MIVNERLAAYINSLDAGNKEYLEVLEREALNNHVPVIRRETQTFLKLLLCLKKPARILEVGTAVGFSALLMAEYHPGDCHITTIEKDEKRIVRTGAGPEREFPAKCFRAMNGKNPGISVRKRGKPFGTLGGERQRVPGIQL